MSLKLVHSHDGPRFTHRATGYNTDPTKDRTVFYGGKSLCRLMQNLNGAWYFHADWAGLHGTVTALSFDEALQNIKYLHARCVS